MIEKILKINKPVVNGDKHIWGEKLNIIIDIFMGKINELIDSIKGFDSTITHKITESKTQLKQEIAREYVPLSEHTSTQSKVSNNESNINSLRTEILALKEDGKRTKVSLTSSNTNIDRLDREITQLKNTDDTFLSRIQGIETINNKQTNDIISLENNKVNKTYFNTEKGKIDTRLTKLESKKEVDLSPFVTKASLTDKGFITLTDVTKEITNNLGNYVKTSELQSSIVTLKQERTNDLASYVLKNELNTTLNNYVTNSTMTNTLTNYVEKNNIQNVVRVTDLKNYYTKSETDSKILTTDRINTIIENKVRPIVNSVAYSKSDTYSKVETNNLLNTRVEVGTLYSKEEVDRKIKEIFDRELATTTTDLQQFILQSYQSKADKTDLDDLTNRFDRLNFSDYISKSIATAQTIASPITMNSTLTIKKNLNVTGEIVSQDNITAFSDKRLKHNIKKLENVLNKLDNVNGYSFTLNHSNKESIGLIAQEILQEFPQLVSKHDLEGQEYLTVNYSNFVGVLLQAIKELNDRVIELEKRSNNG